VRRTIDKSRRRAHKLQNRPRVYRVEIR
jgi:hypothetical protein